MLLIDRLTGLARPKLALTDRELSQALRMMIWEGIASTAFFRVISSGLLAAFALALGANNLQIGIMAAIPFITQPIQIPVILLVERLRRRKAIVLASWVPAQAMWILVALIPLIVDGPGPLALTFLLGFLAFRGILVAVTNCAWSSWEKDLVPQGILGSFFPSRWPYLTWRPSVLGWQPPCSWTTGRGRSLQKIKY